MRQRQLDDEARLGVFACLWGASTSMACSGRLGRHSGVLKRELMVSWAGGRLIVAARETQSLSAEVDGLSGWRVGAIYSGDGQSPAAMGGLVDPRVNLVICGRWC